MPNPHLLADEDFRADALSGVHPVLRRKYQPRNPMGKCLACGQPFLLKDMTEDGLCFEDHRIVKLLEEGKLA